MDENNRDKVEDMLNLNHGGVILVTGNPLEIVDGFLQVFSGNIMLQFNIG